MLTRIDDLSLKFLKLLLPEQGFLIAAIKNPKAKGFKPTIFASTIEELWTTIENADRDGFETYHACASFREALNDPPGTPDKDKRLGRTKHNAFAVKAFWLDIDVGQGKGFSSQDAAISALKNFCARLGLPDPIIVSSGSGLHIYWPLLQTLNRETWERYAAGLKSMCARHGLHADAARTADISSVLRTPGTHNRKHGTVLKVELDPEFLDIQPYSIDSFKVFADHADVQQQKGRSRFDPHGIFELSNHPDLSYLAKRNRKLVGFAGLDSGYPPCSGELIAEQCEQVRALRDRKGDLTEPLWYAALEVLAFTDDGERLAHEWSSGDHRYTQQETQERLDRARQFGPTTCERFHYLNATICERCPQWGTNNVKSPITLGRQNAPPQTGPTATHTTAQKTQRWEYTRGNSLKPKSYINAATALRQLGIQFRHDIFHNKKIVEGDVAENLGRELSDATCRALRDLIITRYNVDCGIENVQQAAERACEENRFDPVLDYLESLQWDGQPRLDRWIIEYLGAEDTSLNRSIGRKMLVAAVRRARQPGCKFDYVVVLEGRQGAGKSSALRILAGEENFSDQPVLHLESRTQQEAIEGVWIYELSELAGRKSKQ